RPGDAVEMWFSAASACDVREPRPKPAAARPAAIASIFAPRPPYVRAGFPGGTSATASGGPRMGAASKCESVARGCRGAARDDIAGPGELFNSKLTLTRIDGKDLHRDRLALERHGAERLQRDAVAQRRAGGLGDQGEELGAPRVR